MLRRNWKPWLLGWVLGFIIGAVFLGIAITFINNGVGWLLLASLSLAIYTVLAFRRKWKPSLIATLLGIVVNPLPWLGLLSMAFACGWGATDRYCSFV